MHKISFLIFIFISILISYTHAQNTIDNDSLNLVQSVDTSLQYFSEYMKYHPVEKIYMQFDKPYYSLGEICWFKFYIVNAIDLNPTNISGIVYADIINPQNKIIKHLQYKISDGEAHGDYKFENDLPEGNYVIRAYTKWMLNEGSSYFFIKSIELINTSKTGFNDIIRDNNRDNIDLQFFPEGGMPINNLQTIVAFKAITHNAKAVDVKGKIVNQNGQIITSFRSVHEGMGQFEYTPISNNTYYAITENGVKFQLPSALDSGFIMNVNNIRRDEIIIKIEATKNYLNKFYSIIGQERGIILFHNIFKCINPIQEIIISKINLPDGILQLTLFDSQHNPCSERIIFISNDHNFSIELNSNKEKLLPHDSIGFKMHITDQDGFPLKASVSLSITDAELINEDPNENNIFTQLLLESDLHGYIQDPWSYFTSNDPLRKKFLDLIMLTNGWRRFKWGKSTNPNIYSKYEPEKGLPIIGQVLSKRDSTPIPFANLTLVTFNKEFGGMYFTSTDSLGNFDIQNVDHTDSTELNWQIINRKGKKIDAAIILSNRSSIIPDVNIPNNLRPTKNINSLIENLIKRYEETGIWNQDNVVLLKEIEVKAKPITKITQVGVNRNIITPSDRDYGVNAAQYIKRYAMGLSFMQLRKRANGEEVWQSPSGGSVHVNIDGFPQSVDALSFLQVEDIQTIMISGTPLQGYSIAIRTRKDFKGQPELGLIKIFGEGYEWTREFYQPKYVHKAETYGVPDNRTTLLWNPNIRTDSTGNVLFSFYNNDNTKKIHVVIEGLSGGIPIFYSKEMGD